MAVLDLNRLVDAVADLEMEFVVLFGSHADGTQRWDSDVDVAVMPSPATPPGALDVLRKMSRCLERSDLDLVWLPEATWLMEWQVALHGQLLSERRAGTFDA